MREFEEATRRALEELAGRDPALMASSAAAVLQLPRPEPHPDLPGRRGPGGLPGRGGHRGRRTRRGRVALIILHYLLGAQRLEPAREWIAYRDLPGARYHDSAFRAEVELPLAEALQESPEAISAWVGEKGLERSEHGGISFVWHALPRVPLLFVLNPADEEFPAEARVFYDATAPSHLPTEDLETLAELAARRLIETL